MPRQRDSRGRFVSGSGGPKPRIRFKWRGREATETVARGVQRRVTVATAMLHAQVTKNISKSVGRSGGRVTERSRKGEYPRADTTQLMKTLFWDVRRSGASTDGFVGTPLDYGVILEVSKRLDRSYMVRTLMEMRTKLKVQVTKPIRR
jgi:hypothetical protein